MANDSISTVVTINGQNFQLRSMSAAEGAKLYAALPPAYQRRADGIAHFIEDFRREIKDIPPELLTEDGMTKLKNALALGNGYLSPDAQQWMKNAVEGPFGTMLRNSGAYKGIKGVADTIQYGSEAADQGLEGFFFPEHALMYAYRLAHNTVSDAVNTQPQATHAQALALAAAYEGALYMQLDSPQAPETIRRRAPNFFDNTAGFIGHELSVGLHFLHPYSPDLAVFLRAIPAFITNGFNWSQAYEYAQTKIDQEVASGGAVSQKAIVDGFVTERIQATARPRAAAMMEEVDEVAGIKTSRLIGKIDGDTSVTYVGQNGTVKSVTPNAQQGATTASVTTPSGAPLKEADITRQQQGSLLGNLGTSDSPLVNAVGLGAAAVGTVAAARIAPPLMRMTGSAVVGTAKLGKNIVTGAVEGAKLAAVGTASGIVNASTGFASGVVQGTANLVSASAREFDRASGKLSTAEIRRALLQENIDKANERIANSAEKIADLKPLADLERDSRWYERRPNTRAMNKEAGAMRKDELLVRQTEKALAGADTKVAAANARVGEIVTRAAETAQQSGGLTRATMQAASNLTDAADKIGQIGGHALEILHGSASVVTTVSRASRVFKFARFAGKAVPMVGVLFTGAELMGMRRANAAENDHSSYWTKLSDDYAAGKISGKEFAAYRSLQVAYGASGVGGIITAGITEAAQNGLEQLDLKKLPDYLPESMVATVGDMVKDARRGNADSALQTAATDATLRAQAAARDAASPARASNVVADGANQQGATPTPPKGMLSALESSMFLMP